MITGLHELLRKVVGRMFSPYVGLSFTACFHPFVSQFTFTSLSFAAILR